MGEDLSFVFLALPLYDAGTGRYAFRHPDVTADGGTFADGDASQDGGVGIDNHIVFQYRVAGNAFDRIPLLVAGEALGPQSNSLIQLHVVTDDASCSDDHTCAVVNGEVVSDLGPRMDVDTCFGMGHFGDDSWNERNIEPVKFVGNPVVGHGPDDWITADDFPEARGGRVTVVGSLYVCGQDATDFRQTADELRRQLGRCGPAGRLTVTLSLVFHAEAQSGLYLFDEQGKQLFDVDPDVVVDGLAVDGRVSEIAWKQDGTCQFHNPFQRFSRGERFPFPMLMEQSPVGLVIGKFVNGLSQYMRVISWTHGHFILIMDKSSDIL